MAQLSIWLIIFYMISAAFPWSALGDVEDESIAFQDFHNLWHGYKRSPVLAHHLEDRSMAEHGNEHMKRWYGVKQLGAAPGQSTSNVQPWPVTCTTPEIVQTLKYCFVNERSHKNLEKILAQGIAKWAHAMTVSSLRIDLAPSAGGDPSRYCSQLDKADLDTLAIEDVTRDGDADWNNGKSAASTGAGNVEDKSRRCATETTTGYSYIDPKSGEMGGNHRHTLNFCMRDPDHPPAEGSEEWHEAVRGMTHELGHAIGLQHEHQRPDRDEHLWIRWKNFEGYAEMLAAVKADEQGLFDNPYDSDDSGHSAFEPYSDKVREYQARSEEQAAAAYFPIALDYIKGDHFTYEPKKSEYSSYKFSNKFDYDSIMMYSSTMATPDGSTKFSITRKTGNGLEPVWMGGSSDKAKAAPSAGDIARVAMLYDNHSPECEAAKDGGNWGQRGGLRVKIREVEVEVPPVRAVERNELRGSGEMGCERGVVEKVCLMTWFLFCEFTARGHSALWNNGARQWCLSTKSIREH